jgi:hypothetical protein
VSERETCWAAAASAFVRDDSRAADAIGGGLTERKKGTKKK